MRIGHCYGVTLKRKPRIELWICFSGVEPHRHPGQHVEVMPLFGWATFTRIVNHAEQEVKVRPGTWFKWFSLPNGCVHWFKGKVIFLNKSDRSAAGNYVPYRKIC